MIATTCYCEDCHAQGRAPYVKDTYTRAWMRECRDRDRRARALEEQQIQNKPITRPAQQDDNGWWNQEGAPTA